MRFSFFFLVFPYYFWSLIFWQKRRNNSERDVFRMIFFTITYLFCLCYIRVIIFLWIITVFHAIACIFSLTQIRPVQKHFLPERIIFLSSFLCFLQIFVKFVMLLLSLLRVLPHAHISKRSSGKYTMWQMPETKIQSWTRMQVLWSLPVHWKTSQTVLKY